MRRVMVILLQEKNLGPNVLYYVFVICLSLKGLPEPSSPSHPSLGVGQQDKNITNGGKKQKYVRASVKNICSGKPAKIYGWGRPEVLLKSAR